MQYEKIIKSLPLFLDHPPTELKRLTGGLTNVTYLIVRAEERFVARFALPANTPLGLNRRREIYNTRRAAQSGFGPEVRGFYPKYNLLVVEYLPGTILTRRLAKQPATIVALVELLQKLHRGPPFRGVFNPFNIIRKHLSAAQKHLGTLPAKWAESLIMLQVIEAKLGPLDYRYPCHIDLMLENIIVCNGCFSLIDWEYSALSDYRYDLAMLSVKGFFTEEQDRLLLKSSGLTSKRSHDEFRLIKAVVCLREAAWGFLQLEISTLPVDYKKYAEEHLRRFWRFTAGV